MRAFGPNVYKFNGCGGPSNVAIYTLLSIQPRGRKKSRHTPHARHTFLRDKIRLPRSTILLFRFCNEIFFRVSSLINIDNLLFSCFSSLYKSDVSKKTCGLESTESFESLYNTRRCFFSVANL